MTHRYARPNILPVLEGTKTDPRASLLIKSYHEIDPKTGRLVAGTRPITKTQRRDMPVYMVSLNGGRAMRWVTNVGENIREVKNPDHVFVQDAHGYRQATRSEISWARDYACGLTEPGIPGIKLYKIRKGMAVEIDPRRVKGQPLLGPPPIDSHD